MKNQIILNKDGLDGRQRWVNIKSNRIMFQSLFVILILLEFQSCSTNSYIVKSVKFKNDLAIDSSFLKYRVVRKDSVIRYSYLNIQRKDSLSIQFGKDTILQNLDFPIRLKKCKSKELVIGNTKFEIIHLVYNEPNYIDLTASVFWNSKYGIIMIKGHEGSTEIRFYNNNFYNSMEILSMLDIDSKENEWFFSTDSFPAPPPSVGDSL